MSTTQVWVALGNFAGKKKNTENLKPQLETTTGPYNLSNIFSSFDQRAYTRLSLAEDEELGLLSSKNSGDDDEAEFGEELSIVPVVASSGLQLWP